MPYTANFVMTKKFNALQFHESPEYIIHSLFFNHQYIHSPANISQHGQINKSITFSAPGIYGHCVKVN